MSAFNSTSVQLIVAKQLIVTQGITSTKKLRTSPTEDLISIDIH